MEGELESEDVCEICGGTDENAIFCPMCCKETDSENCETCPFDGECANQLNSEDA
jgi:hypothetical protein